jgi:hypothetical protein
MDMAIEPPEPVVYALELDFYPQPQLAFETIFGQDEVRYWLDSAKVNYSSDISKKVLAVFF